MTVSQSESPVPGVMIKEFWVKVTTAPFGHSDEVFRRWNPKSMWSNGYGRAQRVCLTEAGGGAQTCRPDSDSIRPYCNCSPEDNYHQQGPFHWFRPLYRTLDDEATRVKVKQAGIRPKSHIVSS